MIYILQRERTEYSGSSISDRYESIERSYYESVEDAQNAIEALKEEKKKDNPDLKYHEGKNSISFPTLMSQSSHKTCGIERKSAKRLSRRKTSMMKRERRACFEDCFSAPIAEVA